MAKSRHAQQTSAVYLRFSFRLNLALCTFYVFYNGAFYLLKDLTNNQITPLGVYKLITCQSLHRFKRHAFTSDVRLHGRLLV